MPKSKKRFLCGHKGFGGFCHRCSMADKLEEIVQSGKKYTDCKNHKKPHVWTKKEMLDEIHRLRNEDKTHL